LSSNNQLVRQYTASLFTDIFTMTSEQSQFLILLRQPHEGPGPTPQELAQIMARFNDWMSAMKAKGIVVGTNGLAPIGKVLRSPGATTIIDGPYCETKEIVGGYVLIRAENLQQAVGFASDCPGLDYRMTIEVRPVV
jgi:hypothetical protein